VYGAANTAGDWLVMEYSTRAVRAGRGGILDAQWQQWTRLDR
jgi:hypothetical protein